MPIAIREKRLLQGISEGLTIADAAKYAGYKCSSPQSFSSVGCQVLKKLNIDISELADRMGFTDEVLLQKVGELLQARRATYAIYKGKFTGVKYDPDYIAIDKGIDKLAKLKGKYIDKVELTGKDGGDIELVISPAGLKREKTLEIE